MPCRDIERESGPMAYGGGGIGDAGMPCRDIERGPAVTKKVTILTSSRSLTS